MTEEKIMILIKKAEVKIEKIANRLLVNHDLTSTQLKILVILLKNQESNLRQIDLEKHFYLTNPTVTGILNNMEKKGLIKRIKNPLDSRSKIIALTEETLQRKDELLAIYEELELNLTKNLTALEVKLLAGLLTKILIEKGE